MRRMDKLGQMGMVGAAVGLFITLIITVLIYYNIAASIDTTTVDGKFGATFNATTHVWMSGYAPAYNATQGINSQAGTFFTIAPIIGIVIVAVVVIGYVQRIGGQ